MIRKIHWLALEVVFTSLVCLGAVPLQTLGTGTIQGTVTDQSGAVIENATVTVTHAVSHYQSSAQTDANGAFTLHNLPLDQLHLVVTAPGFQPIEQTISVKSSLPIVLNLQLPIAAGSTTVNVEAGAENLIENEPTMHTDLDSALLERLPKESLSSGLSSVIMQATPGVVADSNGSFHPLGEHSDTTFVVDNQPVSDQQSRTFSNQLSTSTVQSMEVVSGVPPAEFGDKLSLVVRTTTKSGLGSKGVHGSIDTSYGSFGTGTASFTLGFGSDKFGNFVAIDGLRSGRFLDSPEFLPLHDIGNSGNFFDRVDYQATSDDTIHLNLGLQRSWFQIPNQYDQQVAGQDQRQQVRSFNFAPGWTHLFNNSTLLTANAYVRQDRVNYYPSGNAFSDQPATFSETRRLTNAGVRADLSYDRGSHSIKGGFEFSHTLLSENFGIGLTDPSYNAVCLNADGTADSSPLPLNPAQCSVLGLSANPAFQPGLLTLDLTRGGSLFRFRGHGDIREESAYLQDAIKIDNLTMNVGVRGDNYNGLSNGHAVQPRLGLSYLVKPAHTILRASYGRLFLTPYNENLVLSSSTGLGGLASGSFGEHPLTPAIRNQFNVGFQQAVGNHVSIDAEYFWKFTDDDFDFDVLFNSPLTFPIQWRKSKIDGLSVRVNLPEFHGLTAYSVLGHTRARFFAPEVGGILFNSPIDNEVFRIDHDQAFQQNTHLQYQPKADLPWFSFSWSYQSGVVAGSIPDYATALSLTPDQQQQAGVFCGSTVATLFAPIRSCSSPNYGATRVNIPAPGTYNADRNPARIRPRNQFDAGIGMDNLFHTDRYKWRASFTVVNLTNVEALYNILSTFSGTHFVSPRAYTMSIGMTF